MAGSAGKPYKHMPHEYNIDGFEHELQQVSARILG